MSTFVRELLARSLLQPVRDLCRSRGVRVDDLRGPARGAAIVSARADVARFLRAFGWSMNEIAALLGYKDHTGVAHLLRRGGKPALFAPEATSYVDGLLAVRDTAEAIRLRGVNRP